ncbi:MAG: PAS domain S-box protein [Sphingobacteriales bacterium]|nr:MAG: PAS domain S-box protein [Sphingobacteriales bacterium]
MKKLKHWWLYFLVAGTTLILFVANYVIDSYNERQHVSYLHTLQTAEKQISRSEQLSKMAIHATYGGIINAEQAKNEMQLWDQVHFSLQWGDGSFGLTQHFPEGITSGFTSLNPVQKDLLNTLAAVFDGKRDTMAVKKILKLERQYADDMEQIISAIEQRAVSEADDGHMADLIANIILSIVLLLEIGLLVYPYHRKLLRAHNELMVRNEEVEVHKRNAEVMSDMQNLIIMGTNAGIWEWDLVTGATFWSPRLYHMLGYQIDEISSGYENFQYQVVHPDDREKQADALARHLRDHTPYDVVLRLRNKSGAYKWYELTAQATWDMKGQPLRMAGSVIDIDEQTRYRSQLEYSEYILKEAGKLAQVGSWEYDVVNDESTWSDTMYQITETDPDDDHRPDARFDLYPETDRAILRTLFKRGVEEGVPYDVEMRVDTPTGKQKWVRIISRSFKDENDKVVKLRGVYQDITQQKQRELELQQIQAQLSETNATKDKLFSIIAHDLRSPINNMKALIDMEQNGILTQEEFMTYLGQIKQNTDYLSGAMDNMLYWAMSQLEGFKMKPRKVNIADTVKNAMNLYSSMLTEKNISVINNTDPRHCAFADADQSFLIVRNLLSNAIKFTPIGGDIYLQTNVDGNDVSLSIQDNGAGISNADIEKIKNSNSLHSTRGTEGEKGTGLGLGLCFEMAERNNGSIDIVSKPGKGSIFTVTLPLAVE